MNGLKIIALLDSPSPMDCLRLNLCLLKVVSGADAWQCVYSCQSLRHFFKLRVLNRLRYVKSGKTATVKLHMDPDNSPSDRNTWSDASRAVSSSVT
jgi:hypothetical protein